MRRPTRPFTLSTHTSDCTQRCLLSAMASVTSEDDVHLKAAYPDGTVVEFKIPEIYPNVLFLC